MRLTNTHREAFVRAVLGDVPHIDYDEQMRAILAEDAIQALPAAVAKLARDPKMNGYLNTFYYYSRGNIPSASLYGSGRDDYQPSATASQKLEELSRLKTAQSRVREELKDKVTSAIGACSTRKIALERMPEFEKYLPPDIESKTTYLPVISNLVTDLAAAGWPKGKATTAAA